MRVQTGALHRRKPGVRPRWYSSGVSETLPDRFRSALTIIEVSGDKAKRAQEAHAELRDHLAAAPTLIERGVQTLLIGSYRRQTGIYPGKDVDVFVKLTKLDTSTSPADAFAAVRDALTAVYGGAGPAAAAVGQGAVRGGRLLGRRCPSSQARYAGQSRTTILISGPQPTRGGWQPIQNDSQS